MSTALKASLEKAIQDWCDKECENSELWPRDMWWPEGMTEKMASAAYIVLAANLEGQQFAKEQERT